MAIKKTGLPKGIMWREDKKKYLGRVTYQGKTHNLYDDNYKKLEIKLNALRSELASGMYVERSNSTLNEWFDEWIQTYKKSTVKLSTYENYKQHYDFYVRKGMGKKKLKDIMADDIQFLYNDLANRDFALGTIKFMGAVLGGCMKKAVNLHMIPYDPVVMAEYPICKDKKERYVFTKEQQRQFIEYSKSSYLHRFFLCVLMSGMRNGEARALRWCDIDFEKRSININHTLIWKSQEAYILDTPKTKTSKRQIPMLSQCYEILREIKTEAGQAGLCGRENFVFCLPDGVPINRWRVAIELEKIESAMQADGIEIGHFTCHSLRHTFATRAIENGMKPQVLKTILGHSSLAITMDLYAHVLGDEKVKEMELLEGVF